MENPVAFGQARRDEIAQLAEVADLALMSWEKAWPEVEPALGSDNPWIRYWALTVCVQFGAQAETAVTRAQRLAGDENEMVRVRAAEFLGSLGAGDPRPILQEVLRVTESQVVALLALQAVVYLRDGPRGWGFKIGPESVRAKGGEVNRRLEYLNRR
jgi:HEAT repeat protein